MYPALTTPAALHRHPGAASESSSDQQLLASTRQAEWRNDSDPLRVLRIQAEFVESFSQLAALPQAVSVFGSARTPRDHPYYAQAVELGAALARAGFAVITGGGPGAMEAANRGCQEAGGYSVGLGIELPFEQALNEYLDLGLNFHYFFSRKVNFVRAASAFIVLPGGLGTFDELFEALTLVQTRKVRSFPVVLLGTAYWSGLVEWLRDTVAAEAMISPEDLELFHVTDSVAEAVEIVSAVRRNTPTPPAAAPMLDDRPAERPE